MKSTFLMKPLAAAAVCALLLAGCAGMGGGGGNGVEPLSMGNYSNIKDEQYKDVHTQADLDALWTQAFANMSGAPDKPMVDFSKNMVLAMFLGDQKHGGYLVRFTDFSVTGDTASVTVEVIIPGTNCRYPNRPSNPFAFALAPAAKQVTFNVVQRNAPPCG
ncbi:MAG TPA: hypothetical protein VJS89_02515 [Gammaproteobacteria bacterium]|nr:hypothetical protein [Gammaproteobacteria bacterium]